MRLISLYLILTFMVFSNTQETEVYVVVSSHLDAGWIATFDEYYFGQRTPYGENTKGIYNSVMPKLEQNSNLTYTISELCFFARWWDDQSDLMKDRVKKLIQNKQIDFVNGGWVAHDEATTTYEDMLENLAQGSVWLKNTLGLEVDIGWQLDSFGTSSTHASLLAQAGYRMLFFSRLDYMDRKMRRDKQELEFIWRPSSPHNSSLLTHIFGFQYEKVPYLQRGGYIGGVFRGGKLSEKELNDVENYINSEVKVFRSSNLLMTLVGDFYNPSNDYAGMQDMVDHFNNMKNSNISMKFSSLATFTDSLYRDLNLDTLSAKTDDFFPYISSYDTTWSGYFSSKPSFKALLRGVSHYLNAIRILHMRMTFTLKHQSYDDLWAALTKLARIVSIIQHHDAVTGTSKERVRYNYEDMMMKVVQEVETQIGPLLTQFILMEYKDQKITKDEQNNTESINVGSKLSLRPEIQFFSFLSDNENSYSQLILDPIFWGGNQLKGNKTIKDDNIPLSFLESSEPFYVFGFNPGMTHETVVSLSIPKKETYNLRVEDNTGQTFSPDVFCLNIPHDTCYIRWVDQFSRLQTKIYRIIQDLNINLKPIAGNELNFSTESSSSALKQTQEIQITKTKSLAILSDYQTLHITNCEESSINCHTDHIELKYVYYNSSNSSGAYQFQPASNGVKTSILNIKGARLYHGKQFVILEVYNSKVTSQIIFRNSDANKVNGFEVITLVEGSIADAAGCEIILSLKYLDLTENSGSDPNPFYVDTNGYYFASRIYGVKDDKANDNSTINLPRNIYPMTTMMYVNDIEKRMTVITDRAQGVTQIPSGEVEVMIHRVTRYDDDKGVNEPLDEKDPTNNTLRLNVTTRHFVLLTDASDSNEQARLSSLVYEQPLQLWSVSDISTDLFTSTNKVQPGLITDESDQADKKDQIDSIQDTFIKLSVVDSIEEKVLIRLHNIHGSKTQQLSFCDDNSSITMDFFKMLGSPSSSYLEGIKSITEIHLTNHKTLANISCGTQIQLVPQDLKTFQIHFNINAPELESLFTYLKWGLIAAYIVIGLGVGHIVMKKNGSFGISNVLLKIGVYILFALFWILILLFSVIINRKAKARKDEELLDNIENDTKERCDAFENSNPILDNKDL